MKKRNFLMSLSILTLIGFSVAAPVLADTDAGAKSALNPEVFIELLTLVVVGGIVYNLWVSSSLGGLLGNALKWVGAGVVLLALNTIDATVEGLTSVGSETLLGTGVLHDAVHDGVVLLGFIILSLGLSKVSKVVRGIKG